MGLQSVKKRGASLVLRHYRSPDAGLSVRSALVKCPSRCLTCVISIWRYIIPLPSCCPRPPSSHYPPPVPPPPLPSPCPTPRRAFDIHAASRPPRLVADPQVDTRDSAARAVRRSRSRWERGKEEGQRGARWSNGGRKARRKGRKPRRWKAARESEMSAETPGRGRVTDAHLLR